MSDWFEVPTGICLCFRSSSGTGTNYFQYAISEICLGLFDLGALRQRDQPIEAPIYSFRVTASRLPPTCARAGAPP